jgi:hypothetical protein
VETGELLTRWAVRLSVALYVLALALRLVGRWPRLARAAWTVGALALVVHVGCAFHFYHGWSHAAAYADTARRTAEVTGLDWGGGLYANHAFALLWLADAAWWWAAPEAYARRPAWVEALVQGYLGFLAFNATVVFAQGPARWLGVAGLVLLGGLAVRRAWSRAR